MHFKGIGVHADVKYIDPTYMVRACRANASDAILCTVLGQNAVSYLFFLNDLVVHLFELLQSGYMKNITILPCLQVHAAFAGFSGITSCICNNHYVYLPITEVITAPKRVNPNSRMLHRCLTSTGQPDFH
jgi:6-phosphofructokinase 1